MSCQFNKYQRYVDQIVDGVVYYDIDTTGGQSGSPVYPADKDKVKLTGIKWACSNFS